MTEIARRMAAGLSYLARDGAGIPIVLLHGIGSNAQSFEPLMRALDRPALAWDAPGYGASEPLAAQWPDASDYAAAVDRWLAGVGVIYRMVTISMKALWRPSPVRCCSSQRAR